ncbi:MAG: flavin reductase [Gemmatimonadales bacterium]|nr:flavin reductase [Gemmatimonadales bacterium]
MASAEIAELFRRVTLGLYVVGAADGERRDAFTAAWLTQVSFDPLLLALSVNPQNASHRLLHAGGGFTVSVLEETQQEVARHFGLSSGRDRDKLAGIAWRPGRRGAPVLRDALAWFECELAGAMPAGDHELVLGRVVDGGLLLPGARPLTYAATGDMDGSSALYPARLSA